MRDFIKKHSLIFKICGFVLVCLVLTAVLIRPVLALRDEAVREKFVAFVDSLGWQGPIFLLLVVMLQVFIAVIPGEPIEIIAGLMYGAVWGCIICLIGTTIATIIIYYSIRRFGKNKLDEIIKKEENSKYSFLLRTDRVTYVVFALFLIPGTPKDALTYIVPFTTINPIVYFLIVFFARIPSVITSTIVGAGISEGNVLFSVIMLACTGVIGICGIALNNYFVSRKNKLRENSSHE